MNTAGFQINAKREFYEGLVSMIDDTLSYGYVDFDDKLIMANLFELSNRIKVKLVKYQVDYTITLTPAQSIALKLFYTDFIDDTKSYMGSKLLVITNEIEAKYQ